MDSDEPPPKKMKKDETEAQPDDNDNTEQSDDDTTTEGANRDVNSDYEIREVSRNIARRYGMEVFNFEARMINERLRNRPLLDITDSLRGMFQQMLDRAGQHYGAEDRIRLHIEHSDLDTPIVVHIQPKHNVTADTVLDR